MKTRKHHNNKGLRQIKTGKTVKQVEGMARRLRRAEVPKTYTIKPLKWETNTPEEGNDYFAYESISGTYYNLFLHVQDDGSPHWRMLLGCSNEGSYPSLEEGKQAAQDHWEERLKGALEEVKV